MPKMPTGRSRPLHRPVIPPDGLSAFVDEANVRAYPPDVFEELFRLMRLEVCAPLGIMDRIEYSPLDSTFAQLRRYHLRQGRLARSCHAYDHAMRHYFASLFFEAFFMSRRCLMTALIRSTKTPILVFVFG